MDERRAEKIVQLLEQHLNLSAEMERLHPESDLLVELYVGSVGRHTKLWLDRKMLYMLLKHQRFEVWTKLLEFGLDMRENDDATTDE